MTRLPFFKNRRLLTLLLIVFILVFSGIAVFLAITINSRNVNPDETSASECIDYSMNPENYNCNGYCDSTSCPFAFCCTPDMDCRPEAQCPETKCTIIDRGTKCGQDAGCPEGKGKQFRTKQCEGKPDEDISDKDCTSKQYCEPPKMIKCKEYDNNDPSNGCPSTLPTKKCAKYCLKCPNPDGTGGEGCIDTCSECGATSAPTGIPNPTINPPDTSNWPSGATCRYEAGGGKCAKSEFKAGSCNPGDGQMCFCRNEIVTLRDPRDGKEYRYGTVVLGPLTCGAECNSESKSIGGYFYDTSCKNPYKCPNKTTTRPTPTPPPQPTCTNECIKDTNIWVTYCTLQDGTKQEILRTTGSYCGEMTCPETTKCEGTDLVTRDCRGKEKPGTRIELFKDCLPPEERKTGSCRSLTVSYSGSDKSATSDNPSLGTPVTIDSLPGAGQQISFSSTGKDSSVVSIYWMRPYYKYPPNNNIDIVGTIEHTCSFYVFDPRGSQNGSFTMPSGFPNNVKRNDDFGRPKCENYPVDYTKADGVIFGVNYLPPNTSFNDALWCRNTGPNPNQGSTFLGSVPQGTKCDNPCVVLAKQERVGTCTSLTVSYSGKTATSNNPSLGTPVTIDSLPAAGEPISFNSSGNDSSVLSIYWMRPYIKDQNNPINQLGTKKHTCSFYVFDPRDSQDGRTFTMPSDFPNKVKRNDNYGKKQGCDNDEYAVNYNLADGVIFGVNYLPANTPYDDALRCRNIGPNPNQGSVFRGSNPQNQACNNPCVIMASRVSPSTCTGISITNTRNNASCTPSNPQNCQVRQGDTLTATISGSGNVQGYSLSTIANPGNTQQNRNIQQSPTFTNITVPNNVTLKSFELVGFTSNGDTEVTSNSCRVKFDFNIDTGIQKTINTTGSTGLGSNNVVTTGSVVEYDVTVTNNGSSVLQNVIVYDRIIQIDNGTPNPTTTPFGNILSASNLSRTNGTLSQPNPVTPKQGYPSNQVPFSGTPVPGGTFTSAQGIKLVTWNTITTFHPSETYTGKVKVEIASYTQNPVLRNIVCVVVDSNNNGQPDNGELERCAYQDVNTSTPTFTITKTSSVSSLTPGNSLTYTLTLKNTSSNPLSLSGVTVTDTFDSRYISKVTITPQNGGSLSGNTITWDGTDLIAANNGNTQLAPNGTITLTIQVTFKSDFFSSSDTCEAIVDNSASASSTSPNFSTPPSIVQVTMNNPQCGATPTQKPVDKQPDTGISTPWYLPIGGLLILLTGIGTYLIGRKYASFTKRVSNNRSYSPIEELRRKIRKVR